MAIMGSWLPIQNSRYSSFENAMPMHLIYLSWRTKHKSAARLFFIWMANATQIFIERIWAYWKYIFPINKTILII